MTVPAGPPRDHPRTIDDAISRLREDGGRLTAAKRALLDVLHRSQNALTADQMHEQLVGFDPATIYRALTQFEAAGIVTHSHHGHGPALYRWPHADSLPVVCEACGRVVDLGPRAFKSMARRVHNEHLMVLIPGHFAISGWCEGCLPNYASASAS